MPGGTEGPSVKTANDVRLIQRPAVLVIHDDRGVSEFDLLIADRLAGEGFIAAVPDLFHRSAPVFSSRDIDERRRQLADADITSDVNSAIAYLQTQAYVSYERMAIVGFGMGGRVAYLMAATNPVISIAAAFYAEDLLEGRGALSPFDVTPKIMCPVILFDDDRDTSSNAGGVARVAAELDRHGVSHSVHRYPSADPSFLIGASRASDEAWTDLLDALRRHLPSTAPSAPTRPAHPITPPARD